jgi:hypothetical protein
MVFPIRHNARNGRTVLGMGGMDGVDLGPRGPVDLWIGPWTYQD